MAQKANQVSPGIQELLLAGESKPVVGAAAVVDPAQVRLAPHAIRPDVAGLPVALEGTLLRSHHEHRVHIEFAVEQWVVFTDGEYETRVSLLEDRVLPRPRNRPIPTPAIQAEIKKDGLLLNHARPGRQIEIADLSDIVVVRGVWPRRVDCIMPVPIQNNGNAEDVNSAAGRGLKIGCEHDSPTLFDHLEGGGEGPVGKPPLKTLPAYTLSKGHATHLHCLGHSHIKLLAHELLLF